MREEDKEELVIDTTEGTDKSLKSKLKKTFLSYVHEGIALKLDALLIDRPAMTLAELRQNSMMMVEGSKFDRKAIARVTAQRPKFVPTKMIALSVTIENYAELRRLKDFRGFKNLGTLRYDVEKFMQGVQCLGITDVRRLREPSLIEF